MATVYRRALPRSLRSAAKISSSLPRSPSSKKDDVAKVAGNLRFPHQVQESRQHFRAAACLQVLHVTTRRSQVVRGGGERLRGKLAKAAAEGQDAETVGGHERVQRLKQRAARLLDRCAFHGAGDVNHVKHFHGHALLWRHNGRKRREKKMGFAGAGGRRDKERGFRLLAFCVLYFKDEIFVGNG